MADNGRPHTVRGRTHGITVGLAILRSKTDFQEAVVAPDGAHNDKARHLASDMVVAAALDHTQAGDRAARRREAALIVHDLRNDAFLITTAASFLADVVPTSQARHDVEEIHEASKRVTATARRLRTYFEGLEEL